MIASNRLLLSKCWYSRAAIGIASVLLLSSLSVFAQKGNPRLTQQIDEGKRFILGGNTRPEARAENDRGRVVDHFPLEHMMLQLRRSPEQERALEAFIDQLHDPKSPNFHQWMLAQEFGENFGLAQEDLATITGWLTSHGFAVGAVYLNRMVIDFSGTASQIREAFHTEIHRLEVNGAPHIANMSDPQIPAALAPAITGIVSLHDFRPRPLYRPRSNYTAGSGSYPLVPADLATIYNLNPMFAAGYTGQGQTIVVIEDTNVYTTNDWNTFRSTFGLAAAYPNASFTQVHPGGSGTNNCSNPGAVSGADGEAILDAEWASAAAPNAAIVLASCADTATFGGFIALQNLLNAAGTPPTIVSISYGESETSIGAAGNAAVKALYQQAATAGVSVFVSSGDQLADVTDYGASYGTHGINVNGWGSTPYNVSVGGTDFGDSYAGTNSTYWNATNAANDGSALSYIPEIPWNSSCASVLLASHHGYDTTYGANGFCNSATGVNSYLHLGGGSGGPSACATGTPSTSGVDGGTCAGYPKPSWQSVFGNPSDGVRDLPDVSLFAANGAWGHWYVYCYTDPQGGAPCTGTPNNWSGAGGTSFSAPIMAAIQALINQYTGTRWGNPDPTYYSLASAEYGASGSTSCDSSTGNAVSGSCIFYDVTQGDNNGPCKSTNNCYLPSGTYGVLSLSNSSYQPAYVTTPGWDFATGIGTVNVFNLAKAFNPNSTSYTLTVTISGGGAVTSSPAGINCAPTCSATYSSGTSVTLTATAATGYGLAGWSGACSGTGACSVTMNSNINVVATFNATSPILSISPLSLFFGTALGLSNPAAQTLSISNTGIGTLAWTAATTQSWLTLSSSSGTAPGTVQASVNTAGLAAGSYTDTITVTAAGAQGSPQTISVGLNIRQPVPTVVTLPSKGAPTSVVTLNAMVNPNGLATTYWFQYGQKDRFGKLSQTAQQSLPAGTKDTAVSAQLTGLARHTIYAYAVVASNSAGTAQGQMLDFETAIPAALSSIAVSPSSATLTGQTTTQQFTATGTFAGGQTTNITNAVAWSSSNTGVATINGTGLATAVAAGTSTITAQSGSIHATATLTVGATLTVSKTGTGTGTVTSSSGGINCGSTCSASYTKGTSVTLTAGATSGSTFAGWSGGGCSGTGPCMVTMNSSQTVTATFNAITYTLTVSKSGTGTGTVTSSSGGINCGSTCSANYNSGTLVTLTAAATSGFFGGWSGACSGTGTCTVTMNSSQSVTASFVPTGTTYTMNWNVQNDGTCSSRSSTGYIYYRLFDLTASPKLYYPCTNGSGTQTGCISTTWNWIISTTSTQVSAVSIFCTPGHWIAFGADIDDSDSKGYWGYGINGTESCAAGNSICGAYCAATTDTLPTLTCQ